MESSDFLPQEIGLKKCKDFYSSSFSDFLEILASEATEKPFSKVGEGLEVKGQQRILKIFLR